MDQITNVPYQIHHWQRHMLIIHPSRQSYSVLQLEMIKDMDQPLKSGGYKVGRSKSLVLFLQNVEKVIIIIFCCIDPLADPQSGKTSSSTPATSTTNVAAKRGLDKTHAPSPVKRPKTTVGKKHVLHE